MTCERIFEPFDHLHGAHKKTVTHKTVNEINCKLVHTTRHNLGSTIKMPSDTVNCKTSTKNVLLTNATGTTKPPYRSMTI